MNTKKIEKFLFDFTDMNSEQSRIKAESYGDNYDEFEKEFDAVWDQITECYIYSEASGYCYGQGLITHLDNLFYCDYSGNHFSTKHYYQKEVYGTSSIYSSYYSHYDFDLYYWECDGEIHDEPEPEEEEQDNYNFEYHSSDPDFLADYSEPKIGFEIEKEDYNAMVSFHAHDLQAETGWGKESDSSLNSDGFELVSPVFPLHRGKDYFEEKFSKVSRLINADYSSNCGGHVNYSNPNFSSEELLNEISGWIPLIYSLYEHRLNNRFCEGKTVTELKDERRKYQAINIKSKCLEFRIFPAVKNVKNLLWRLRLIQIMDTNKTWNPLRVIGYMTDENHELHKLLIEIFSYEKLISKVHRVAYFSESMVGHTFDQETINQFTKSIQSKIK